MMAHFAKIDEDNFVTEILVVANDQEHRGQDYLAKDLGLGGRWIQTSYNNRIRKQYAGIGYSYDPIADVFIIPQPYPSWTLDNNHDWQPPIEYPKDGLMYLWNEHKKDWEPYVEGNA